MNGITLEDLPTFATLAKVKVGSDKCCLTAKRALKDEYITDCEYLEAPVLYEDKIVKVPILFFEKAMHAYVSFYEGTVKIERSGCMINTPIMQDDNKYVDALTVLGKMNVDYSWNEEEEVLAVVVETKTAGPRALMPSEMKLPYAKYYDEYWETPFHLRADIKAWAEKFVYYQLTTMRNPKEMLHINNVRKLLNENYRTQTWKEGWTLFDDGSGVTCVKTEFPGTTMNMFQWWFAWHVLEDIRYMLWFPPAHYGIMPTLEYRKILKDKTKTLFEKTHGGDSVHLVYESTPIDALSYSAAGKTPWHSIAFQNPQQRGFEEKDLEYMEKMRCTAICGGTRMLHFFAENKEGTGGTLYTHFWFGLHPDEKLLWKGLKTEQDPAIIQPILNISQHAVKEFAQLAHILPRVYAEEGSKEGL